MVEASVKAGAETVIDHMDKKFEQIFGKGTQENETYDEAKLRLKNARQHEDLAMRQENTARRREEWAGVKAKRAEDKAKAKAEDKAKAKGVQDAIDNEEAEVDRMEIAKAKKAAGKAKGKGKAKAKGKHTTLPETLAHDEAAE